MSLRTYTAKVVHTRKRKDRQTEYYIEVSHMPKYSPFLSSLKYGGVKRVKFIPSSFHKEKEIELVRKSNESAKNFKNFVLRTINELIANENYDLNDLISNGAKPRTKYQELDEKVSQYKKEIESLRMKITDIQYKMCKIPVSERWN